MSEKYREKCLEAKEEKCIVCGSTKNIHVHHLDEDRGNNALSNLIPLCGSCHGKVHSEKLDLRPYLGSAEATTTVQLEGRDHSRLEALDAVYADTGRIRESMIQEAVEEYLKSQFDAEITLSKWQLERLQEGKAVEASADEKGWDNRFLIRRE